METTSVSPSSTGQQIAACSANGGIQTCYDRCEIKDRLRNIVRHHAGLNLAPKEIEDSTDLYYSGMSSQASVVLMIAVESQFGLEFPDAMLNRDVFTNIETIADAVEYVLGVAR